MKTLLALVLVACSGMAAAQRYTCEVDMVDNRTNRIIQTFSVPGLVDCFEAKKACSKERRLLGLLNSATCIEYGENNRRPNHGNGNGNGNGNGHGNGNNGPRTEARRLLTIGESVIYNNRFVTILGQSFNGLISVRSTNGLNTITSGIQRESIIVTSGCSFDLCVSDSVISISTGRYLKVAGLAYNDTFATLSVNGLNTLDSFVPRSDLAETKGCITSRFSQICVGNQVINTSNRYMKVVAIQLNGRVVLQSTNGLNTITTNVEVQDLVVTR